MPEGQVENCVAASNDFQQYWLGAWLPIALGADPAPPLVEVPPLGTSGFTLNGPGSAGNQQNLSSFLTTSSILKPDVYPQFRSPQAITRDGPPTFDPPTGMRYAYSQQADSAYKRLTRTIDLTGRTSASLQFKLSADTESGFDFAFVEAHTVGQDDWTTLPDSNGATSQDVGAGCPDPNPFWLDENPFLRHYITRSGSGDGITCTASGTSGAWNAFTGNSGGFRDWNVDLSAFAGKQVEVSITYATDRAAQGLGVFVDDAKVVADGAALAETSFEDDHGGWTVAGPPADSGPNENDWEATTSVGFVDGPGIATEGSLLWGFGLEGVTGAEARARLMRDAMRYLGAAEG